MDESVTEKMCKERREGIEKEFSVVHKRIDKQDTERNKDREDMEAELKLVHGEIVKTNEAIGTAKDELKSGIIRILIWALITLGGASVTMAITLIISMIKGGGKTP